jgi:nitrate/nitrite transporter NarK
MFYSSHSLGLTMVVVSLWSIFVPMSCGASYGIAPFITRRGLGVATGLIGAGGELPWQPPWRPAPLALGLHMPAPASLPCLPAHRQ